MTTLPEFQIPKISSEDADDNHGTFVVEPLDKGFGYTYGNSLRRVLLSSLGGAAIKSVRIEGVAHEFSTVPGVKEDVTDIVLNLKDIVIRMHTDADEVEAPLVATGPGEVKAKDIDLPAGVEILNPDAPIATLEKRTKLELYLTIGRGRGYSPAEENKTEDQPIGVIPIDSIFSPIRRASYEVDSARVGQRTDFDKLTLEVETDGSIEPGSAVREAAEILIKTMAIFTDADRVEELTAREVPAVDGDGAVRPGRRRDRGRRPPDRGARDRRPRLQLPQARRHPDGRRPRPALGVGAERDPELRQAQHRRGHGGAPRARAEPPRRVAMRHGKQRNKLSRDTAHRRALMRNLCRDVIEHERITTSQAKAKAVKPKLEKLITLAKRGDLHARRQVLVRARPGQVPRPQAVRGGRAALRGASRRLHADRQARPAAVGLDRDGLPRARLALVALRLARAVPTARLLIAYDGSALRGLVGAAGRSGRCQGELESALERILGEQIEPRRSPGAPTRGVHATGAGRELRASRCELPDQPADRLNALLARDRLC